MGAMPKALRSCLFQSNGRIRLLLPSLTKALLGGEAKLPEYAGLTLRHALVALDVDEWRKPLRIAGIDTSMWDFDEAGDIEASVRRRDNEMHQHAEAVEHQDISGQVVDLTPRLRVKTIQSENNWKVGMKEMNQIISAIWRPTYRK